MDGDDERAEAARPPALAFRVPDDDDLLALADLHLPPVDAAPAGLVLGVGALGDDALQLLLARGREQRFAVVELR